MEPTLFVELAVLGSLRDSSSMITLLWAGSLRVSSTTDGMVGRNRTLSFGEEHDGSATSSCTAC